MNRLQQEEEEELLLGLVGTYDVVGYKALLGETAKRHLYDGTVRLATAWERRFQDVADRSFDTDMRECLAIVGEAKQKALTRKATVVWDDAKFSIDEYLKKSVDNWRQQFEPVVSGVITDVTEQRAVALGFEWDVRNLGAEEWLADYTLKFAQPIGDTTIEGVTELLAQAQREGWSIETTQNRLSMLFKAWQQGVKDPDEWQWYEDRIPQNRSELIARTESLRASNIGIYKQMESWQVPAREWLATHDDRTRDSHYAASGQIQPMGKPFRVNGYDMMYPGDMSMGAPLSEVANCRCTTSPILDREWRPR